MSVAELVSEIWKACPLELINFVIVPYISPMVVKNAFGGNIIGRISWEKSRETFQLAAGSAMRNTALLLQVHSWFHGRATVG